MIRIVNWLDKHIDTRGNVVPKTVIVLGALALVTYARWLLDRGEGGFTFSQYFPVLTAAAIIIGWRYAAFAALVSMIIVNRVFLDEHWFNQPVAVRALIVGLYVLTVAVVCATTHLLRTLVREKEELARQVRASNDELRHRSANIVQVLVNWIELGLVQPDPKEYYAKLSDKLVAWTRSNAMLGHSLAGEFAVHDLVELAIRSFQHERIAVDGPADVMVEAARARAIVMAVHELATNSTKYGALARSEGAVRIVWRQEAGRLAFSWNEVGCGADETGAGSGSGLRFLASLDALDEFTVDRKDDTLRARFSFRPDGAGGPAG